MRFSHREETRGDRLLDVLTDDEAGLRIIVSRLGAELVSLARRDAAGNWIGFLHRDNDLTPPPTGWANHATVMGYFLHRLKNERSLYRGQEIRGGTHGFVRHKIFSAPEVSLTNETGALTFHLAPNEYTPSEYPLRVSFALTYALRDGELQVAFAFQNEESELTAHLEFGLHPGFAASSFDSFHLEMPPGLYRRWLAPGNFLSGETENITFSGGEMPFPRAQLPGSLILELVDVPARDFIFRDPPSRREVKINLGDAPYLTLWSDGGPFFCVEPCWGLTDRREQRAFEEKDGIQVILPNEKLRASFALSPRFLPNERWLQR